jgi:leucyl-tRNA synthetase
VNGRLRGRLLVDRDAPEELVRQQALALEGVRRYTDGKQLVKAIVVPNRIVNIVVR